MRKPLLVLSFLISFFSHAQQIDWGITLESQTENFNSFPHYHLATNEFVEVLVAGPKENLFSFSGLYGDISVMIISNDQELLFSELLIGKGTVKAAESHGDDFYILGEYLDSLQIEGLPVLATGVDFLQKTGFLLKMNRNGTPLWAISAETLFPGKSIEAFDISNEGILYLGISDFGNSSDIVQMNSEGEIMESWFQTGLPLITSVSVNSSGEVSIAGSCSEGDVDFNGTNVPEEIDDYNNYAVKYTATGEYIWHHFTLDVTCMDPEVILADDGTTYLANAVNINTTLGSFELESSAWVYSFFASLIGLNGEVLWVQQPSPFGESIGDASLATGKSLIEWNGDILIGGFTRGFQDWGNSFTSELDVLGPSLFLNRIDDMGNTVNLVLSDLTNYTETIHSITPGGNGAFYLLGSVLDTLSIQGVVLPNSGRQLFLTRWNADALSTNSLSKTHIKHYPDPANSQLMIEGAERGDETIIFDLLGREVLRKTLLDNAQFDLSEFTSGTYLLHVIRDNQPIYRSSIRIVN
jgi:hypothetical protein